VRPENRAAVDEELARLEATVAERFGDGVDLDRALVPDRQGLGGPGRAGAAQAALSVATAAVFGATGSSKMPGRLPTAEPDCVEEVVERASDAR
jgi:hypothetical protein